MGITRRGAAGSGAAAALGLMLGAAGTARAATPGAIGFLAAWVGDVDGASAWFVANFGLEIGKSEASPDGKVLVRILRGPGVIVELLQRTDRVPPTPTEDALGLFKAGFTVTGLAGMIERWRGNGVVIVAGPFDDPAFGVRSVIVEGPEKMLIQAFEAIA